MNVKKNVLYLFLSILALLLINVVCRSLVLADVISVKVGNDVILWGTFALMVPSVMVLSRFTMFSRRFYLSTIVLSVYIILLIMQRVIPSMAVVFLASAGIMGAVLSYSVLSGMTKMSKELMSTLVYKKHHRMQNIMACVTAVYLICACVILCVAGSKVGQEKLSQFIFVPIDAVWVVVLAIMSFFAQKLGFASLYKTMSIVELNTLNEEMLLKTKVTEAMTKNFLSCGVFRLKEDDFRMVYAMPYVNKVIEKYSSARDCLDATVEAFTDNIFKPKLREFLDCSTMQERLKGKNIISIDFVGDRMGKCRASLLPISYDEEGEVAEILYTVQNISKELLTLQEQLVLEETVVQCVNIVTQTSDFDDAINRLLATVGDYYGAERCYIYSIDLENNKMTNTYEWCKDGVAPVIDEMQNVELGDWYRWIEGFKKQGMILIVNRREEFTTDSFEARILERQGIDRLLAVPTLDAGGKITGFIGVDNPSERGESEMLMKSISAFVETEMREERHKKQLYELSHKDMMTGCLNRYAYHETIAALNRKAAESVGVIFADVNGLKKTNDTYGHEKGDELLIEAADLLKVHFPLDKVYRIGGDEFVVFCMDISEAEFGLAYQKLVDKLQGKELFSIGKIWIAECSDIEKQIHIADENMYSMKKEYYNKKKK
ncbi:MAG: sensor domain-containing diguanylate cyclase [Lachnospiraceae bacterium]|nr:sensor domain-containing diguanylate cyclase [Lachnospiraceae bacterium]